MEGIDTMDNNLSQLEEKVLNAIRLIKDLRAENAKLEKQRDEIQGLYEAMKEDHHRMSRELEQKQEHSASLERFEEKRIILEEKVGGLLEKLEQIG
jgi:predicted  nucleic acid-binding Zn-ribbon protein